MPSLAARAIRFIFDWNLRPGGKLVFSNAEAMRKSIQDNYLQPHTFSPPKNLGADIIIDRTDTSNWPLYRISTQPQSEAQAQARGAVIYIHGGAWFHEITAQHWHLTAHLARTTDLDVLVPIYPLVPRPTATAKQVIEGLIEICRASVQPIVCLAGDSAGGNISLALAQHLQSTAPDLAKSLQSIVLISPALDLAFNHAEVLRADQRDPWLGIEGSRVLVPYWAGETSISDPIVSPLFGELSNLPPLMVLSGTDDMMNADARRLSARFQGEEGDVCVSGSVSLERFEYVEEQEMIHVFPLLPCPEGAEARRKISEFVKRHRK